MCPRLVMYRRTTKKFLITTGPTRKSFPFHVLVSNVYYSQLKLAIPAQSRNTSYSDFHYHELFISSFNYKKILYHTLQIHISSFSYRYIY